MNKIRCDHEYAKLIIKKGLSNDGDRPLLIEFDSDELKDFVEVLKYEAARMGIKEVVAYNVNTKARYEYLRNTALEDIKPNRLFDTLILEELANAEATMLFLRSYTNVSREGISNEKINKMYSITEEPLENYYNYTVNNRCRWCVACYPTMEWAQKLYPKMNPWEAYDLLYRNIMYMSKVDEKDPSKAWEDLITRYEETTEKLNDLRIQKLHYSNNRGTNLDIYLPDDHIWVGLDEKDYYGKKFLPNLPSYEIYTGPELASTKGTVYSTKPLVYNNELISEFGLEFIDGDVERIITPNSHDRKVLESIIDRDGGSCELGECALVENDTPVGKTQTTYLETLYDENSSCHLALGDSLPNSYENGLEMDDEEKISKGHNVSQNHVDFMVGTDDLEIVADTKKGKKLIFAKGKYQL